MVTGPNGAGKSSLLRLIAGLVRVAGGRLALEGGDPELTIGEQAHYLGHQDALKPSLVGRGEPRLLDALSSAAAPPQDDAALATVGLDGPGRSAGRLSLGRAAAAAVDRAADRGHAADLAAR